MPNRIAVTLLPGVAGALACDAPRTPLPWLIGPLGVTAMASMAGARVAASRALGNGAPWAIGAALGLYFTPQVVAVVVANSLAILAGIAWALVLGLAFGAVLARANRNLAGLNRATTYCASTIGGASEMSLLAERHGARVDLVAASHSMRIALVVISVPLACQWVGLQGLDATLPGPSSCVGRIWRC